MPPSCPIAGSSSSYLEESWNLTEEQKVPFSSDTQYAPRAARKISQKSDPEAATVCAKTVTETSTSLVVMVLPNSTETTPATNWQSKGSTREAEGSIFKLRATGEVPIFQCSATILSSKLANRALNCTTKRADSGSLPMSNQIPTLTTTSWKIQGLPVSVTPKLWSSEGTLPIPLPQISVCSGESAAVNVPKYQSQPWVADCQWPKVFRTVAL